MQSTTPRSSLRSLLPDKQSQLSGLEIEAEPNLERLEADPSLDTICQEAYSAYQRKVRKKWAWANDDGITVPSVETLMKEVQRIQAKTHDKVRMADKVQSYSHALEGFLSMVDNYCSTIGGPGFVASQALVSCIHFSLKLTEDYVNGLVQIEQGLSTMVSILGLSQIFTIIHKESDPEINRRLAIEVEKLYGIALQFWVRAVTSFTPRKFFMGFVKVVWQKYPRHFKEFEQKFQRQLDIISSVSAGLSRHQEVKRKEEKRKIAELEAKYKECVDRFKTASNSPEKYRSELRRISELRHKGTCQWIEEEDAYRGWIEGRTDILWISGQAGMGKSVLASSLVEDSFRRADLEYSGPNDAVLFFFCLHDQPEKRDATAILKSLCYQLFRKLVPSSDALAVEESLAQVVVEDILQHAENAFQGAVSLSYRFHELRAHLENVTIVVDGLDECRKDDIEILLNSILRFVGCQNGKRLKVLITSRPDPPIYNYLIPPIAELQLEDYEDQTFPFTPKGGYKHPIQEGEAPEDLELRHFKLQSKHVSSDIVQYAIYKLGLKAIGMSRAEYSAASIREGKFTSNSRHPNRAGGRFTSFSEEVSSLEGPSDSAIDYNLPRAWTHATSTTAETAVAISQATIVELANNIEKQSQGHFLWVYYVLKEIEENTTRFRRWKDMQDYFADDDGRFESEKNLEDIYARILCRLEKTLYDYAKQFVRCILRWTCCAYRPLRLEEIAEVIKANTERLHFEREIELRSSDEWMNYTEVEIRKLCGSLVTFRTSEDEQQSTRTLHFVHFSIKEFLLNKKPESLQKFADKWDEEFYRTGGSISGQFLVPPELGHAEIFEDCMFYLSHDRFIDPLEHVRGNAFPKERTREFFPLFEYAALNWPRHLMDCSTATNVEMKEVHTTALSSFFGGNTYRTWMEGIVGFKGGIESFFVIQLALQKQLASVDSRRLQAFTNWASDIGGFGFLDYEQTVLHNTNEIHYLDHRFLFPRSSKAYSKRLTDRVRAEVFQKLESPHDEKDKLVREQSGLKLEEQLKFPRQFFSGEDNDETFGFISVDSNQIGKQGVFTIDRKCNHPRLIWERLGAEDLEGTHHTNTRLAKLVQLKKKVAHSIWSTFGAAQSNCGTAVAAILAEAMVKKEAKDQQYRLKVVLWRFRASDTAKLNRWLEGRNTRPGPGVLPTRELEGLRPTVPSLKPSIAGDDWADVEEVGGDRGECIIDQNGPFGGSKDMIAFRGDNTILFPFGIYYITTQEFGPLRDLIEAKEADSTTILPGGQHIVRFTTKDRLSLEILFVDFDGDIAPDSDRPFGATLKTVSMVDARLIEPPLTRFVRVVTCSKSGKYILVLGERKELSTRVLVVVDILNGVGRVIYERPYKPTDSIEILDAVFSADDSRIIFVSELRSTRLFSKVYTLMYYLCTFHKLYIVQDLPARPDNLLLYENWDSMLAIVLSNHRKTLEIGIPETPYSLKNFPTSYSEAELQNVARRIALERQATERHGICRIQHSDVDGIRKPKALIAAYMDVTIKRSKSEGATEFTRTLSIAVNYDIWEASQYSGQDWLWSSDGKFEIPAFDISEAARHSYGIAASEDQQHLVTWCGDQVYYFSTNGKSQGRPLILPVQSEDQHVFCTAVLFHRRKPLAVQLSTFSEGRVSENIGDFLFFWTFSSSEFGAEPFVSSVFDISCHALSLSWHPHEASLFATGISQLSLFELDDGAINCVRIIPRDYVESQVAKLETPNGPASPPSTATTHILDEHETEHQCLRFSSCGTYLFNHRWNTFFDLASLRDLKNSHFSSQSVLADFAAEGDRKNFWSRGISPKHPITMQENMLYSASQQRFKIFNIRTYLVLGWAADANNLWDPIDVKKNIPSTWYRRVLCAIPQSLGGWQATLIWPDEPEARLWVVFFPREFTGGDEKPKTVLCPIRAGDLMAQVRPGDDWLRGHAGSCPYHLGIEAATQ